MSASRIMNKNKKKAQENKKPARAPPPIPDVYESIEPELTYDSFEEADPEDLYAAPNDEESAPPPPARPQRLNKEPLPTPTDEESVYEEAPDEDETDQTNQDTTSEDSHKPPLPPPPRGKNQKEDKKAKPKVVGHGFSLNAIQGALQNLKHKKPAQIQKSDEEPEPLSPRILKPVKLKDKKVESPTSKPEVPERPLPQPPSPQSDVNPNTENNTNGTSTESDTIDAQVENRLQATPPLPRKIEEEEEEEPIYVGAVSDRLTLFDWFHGDISREEGNKRVQTVGKDGTFLVRKSTKYDNQPYTMVLLYQGHVNNLKIRVRNDGRYALGEEKPNEMFFEDVSSMVDFHRKSTVNLTGNNKGETTLKESPSLQT